MSAPQSASKVCSRLSPHISFGTLSVREVEKAVAERRAQLGPQDQMFKRSLSSFHLGWSGVVIYAEAGRPA